VELGHSVTVISDFERETPDQDSNIKVLRIKSVRSPLQKSNHSLYSAILNTNSSVILWHVGLTTFLYQSFPSFPGKLNIGIFTSPLYTFQTFRRIGLRKTLQNYPLSAVHLASAIVPRWVFHLRMQSSGLKGLIVQTHTLHQQLQENGLWSGAIEVIPPGIDPIWNQTPNHSLTHIRQELGITDNEHLLLYFGSPAPLRGLPLLIEAFQIAHKSDPSLRLVILSRRRKGELDNEASNLDKLLKDSPVSSHIYLVDGFLNQEDLISYVAVCDAVALPFELVPSDAPLSLLEASAIGKPIVTTRLSCLPELVPSELSFLAEPSDPISLAQQIMNAVRSSKQDRIKKAAFRTWHDVGKDWSVFLQRLL